MASLYRALGDDALLWHDAHDQHHLAALAAPAGAHHLLGRGLRGLLLPPASRGEDVCRRGVIENCLKLIYK